MTVAETIKQITREHLLEHHGVALGQCLTAVGWVGGTVPELRQEDGLIELSMADVAGGAIAVGFALAGRRPIYIVRYQGFQWYDAPTVANYAAKSKEMWGIPCPVFVRSIAMEGGIGPVASNSHHGIFNRMPGISITAPMTPGEYRKVWNHFMTHDDPMYVSEHRRSFAIDYEMEHVIHEKADIALIAISATRLNAMAAQKELEKQGIIANLYHLLWVKPFQIDGTLEKALASSAHGGIVLDGDYPNSAAKSLAFDIMHKTGVPMNILALEERVAGFAPRLDNLPPSPEKIVNMVKDVITSRRVC